MPTEIINQPVVDELGDVPAPAAGCCPACGRPGTRLLCRPAYFWCWWAPPIETAAALCPEVWWWCVRCAAYFTPIMGARPELAGQKA